MQACETTSERLKESERPVGPRKLPVQTKGCLVIGASRILFCRKETKRVTSSVGDNLRQPRTCRAHDLCDPLELGVNLVSAGSLVLGVASPTTKSKIAAPIVEGVAVFVINHDLWVIDPHYHSMKLDGIRSSYAPSSFGRPMSIPRCVIEERPVLWTDNANKSSRKVGKHMVSTFARGHAAALAVDYGKALNRDASARNRIATREFARRRCSLAAAKARTPPFATASVFDSGEPTESLSGQIGPRFSHGATIYRTTLRGLLRGGNK